MTLFLSILLFLAILSFLIFIHELGHFLVAKKAGMRVDEFALGFPPRIWSKKKGETVYALNAIPFGGYVKIYGEQPGEQEDDPRSFDKKSIWARAAVLFAGVAMNFLFAFVALTIAFSVGFFSISQNLSEIPGSTVTKREVIVTQVQEESPAAEAGLQAGDIVLGLVGPEGEAVAVSSLDELIEYTRVLQDLGAEEVTVRYSREGRETEVVSGLRPEGPALGIAIQNLDMVKVPVWKAPGVALKESGTILALTGDALQGFFSRLFSRGQLDENVSGPIGIYQAVAGAAQIGFAQVLFVTVVLSLNLMLFNLLPFPALDGGRIVFLAIEKIFRGAALQKKIEHAMNAAGFFLLIGLMAVLTARDIFRLF